MADIKIKCRNHVDGKCGSIRKLACTNCYSTYRNSFLDRIDVEDVEDFHKFLQGDYMPKNLHMKNPPRMSKQRAFKIIYYLQEVLGVLPDDFEMCKTCGRIYDSANEGSLNDRHCDCCRRD
jgi:hypothetical protein